MAEQLMVKPVRLPAAPLFDTADVAPGRHVVAVTAGPRRDLVVLSLAGPPDDRRSSAGASFPKLRADSVNRYRIDHLTDGRWSSVALPDTRENFHFVQPLGDGWLLVRGRATGEADRNAHHYGAAGTPAGAFHIGDGVEDVQATGAAGSGSATSTRGCRTDREAVPDIADCYALNVCSGQKVWVCYYTDFPLVRLVDTQFFAVDLDDLTG